MNEPFLKVLSPGLGAAFQDQGRPGWRRFGVPTSGAMDAHAAAYANRLLGNPPWAAVVELLLHGAHLQVRQECWLALTGADLCASHPLWRAFRELNKPEMRRAFSEAELRSSNSRKLASSRTSSASSSHAIRPTSVPWPISI